MIKIAESIASGICEANGAKKSTTQIKNSEWTMPDNLPVAPQLTFITVLIVAPAPASPPNIPATALPKPCPKSSLFESCLVFVIESATSEVSNESIEPSIARVIPNGIIAWKSLIEIKPSSKWGNPKGISPIVFTSNCINIATKVPAINARSEEGQYFVIFFGVKNIIASAKRLNPIADRLMFGKCLNT